MGGVAVGKYIVQIGTLKIPLWAIVAVIVGTAVIAALSVYGVLNSRAQYKSIIQTVSATPTPTPMPKMEGSFNVAVAEFRVEGQDLAIEDHSRIHPIVLELVMLAT